MTHTELHVVRRQLGMSQEALAAELGLTPVIVAAWEEGRLSIPRRYAEDITWRVAAAERQAALTASGLPACEWIIAQERAPRPQNTRAAVKRAEAVQAHAEVCPVCRAREAYLAEHFPPMPPAPLHGWLAAVRRITTAVERLPRWAQPAANGALLFMSYTLLRTLISLPRLLAVPRGWLAVLIALPISAGLGAVVGAAYGGWRTLRTRWAARRASLEPGV